MSLSTDPPADAEDTVRVGLGERAYDIRIGSGLLDRPEAFAGLFSGETSALIVTNTHVGSIYGDRLLAAVRPHHAAVQRIDLPDGEAHKTLATVERIFDVLLRGHADRGTVVYALGGGVVGDVAGFAAACFMRGVPIVQVPTTLLAQVDSSVGGKTGVNHPLGKNMIGAFHQPRRVVIDLDTLETLPGRELVAGLAEVIKVGAVADAALFAWLETHRERLLHREIDALRHAVTASCRIKSQVVGEDERESGRRAILNFGHTIGHAIEAGTGFGNWLHGEAVGCGMVLEAALSVRLGRLSDHERARVAELVGAVGLPLRAPPLPAERYLELMRHDKKSQSGRLRVVLLDGVGHAALHPVNDEDVGAVLRAELTQA
jgi:3-dehydroquinate synthase